MLTIKLWHSACDIDCKLDPYFRDVKKGKNALPTVYLGSLFISALRALLIFYGYVIFHRVNILYCIQVAGHWVVSNLLLLQYCGEWACILLVDKSADVSVG